MDRDAAVVGRVSQARRRRQPIEFKPSTARGDEVWTPSPMEYAISMTALDDLPEMIRTFIHEHAVARGDILWFHEQIRLCRRNPRHVLEQYKRRREAYGIMVTWK